MTTLTHPQARSFLQAEADRRLTGDEARDLNEHLRGCQACRAYGAELEAVASELPRAWRQRWAASLNPSAAVLRNVLAARRPRPGARAWWFGFGFNRLGIVAGLMALLVVTGAAAMTIQSQPGGFGALLGGAESSATPTRTAEAAATMATATECHEACAGHTPEASATLCPDGCETHVAEPSHTPCETGCPTEPHEPSQTPCAPDCASPTSEATRTPESTSTPTPTRPAEVTWTPSPTHEVEVSHTPESTLAPTETQTTEPTHPPEPSATAANTHVPEATWTSSPTHQPEPSATATNAHAPEPTWTPSPTHQAGPTATNVTVHEPTATNAAPPASPAPSPTHV